MDGLPNLATHAGFVSKGKRTLLALRLKKITRMCFFVSNTLAMEGQTKSSTFARFWKPRQNDVPVVFRIDQTKMPDAQVRHFI